MRRHGPGATDWHNPAMSEPPADPYAELPDGVVVVGADGVVLSCNDAAARILGVARDELRGLPVADALPLADAAGRDWWQVTNPFGGLSTRSRQVERVLQLPDGRYLLVTASYVRPARGAARGAHGRLSARDRGA